MRTMVAILLDSATYSPAATGRAVMIALERRADGGIVEAFLRLRQLRPDGFQRRLGILHGAVALARAH